jgi:hypothetical protein
MTRPTWIFVAGTYRSASTTQYRITRDIVEWAGLGMGIGYHTETRLKEFDVPDSPHTYIVCKVFEFLPEGFKGNNDTVQVSHGEIIHRQDRIRAVVTIRDPRDIIVSQRTRTENQGKEFDFKKVATEKMPNWLAWVQKWIDLGPELCYWAKFEDFTLNLLTLTRKIAAHLDIDLPDEQAKEIAARYTIRAQKEKKREFKQNQAPEKREDPWLPSIPEVLFGTSGHSRTWLNGPERAMVYEANKEFFERFGYEGE